MRKKSFVRLREQDVIVVLIDLDEKDALLKAAFLATLRRAARRVHISPR